MPAIPNVTTRRSRLDSAFTRISSLPPDNLEVHSDFARYLCVLVSGFVETAVAQLASEYCKRRSAPQVTNYAQNQLDKLQNVNSEKLLQLLGSFDPTWRQNLETFIDGPRKDALNSVVDLRNKIAHGESVSVTYSRIKEYYGRIVEIIEFVEQTFS